jgi:hypothetical protein
VDVACELGDNRHIDGMRGFIVESRHEHVTEALLKHVHTHLPVARVVHGGPARRLPVGVDLPNDRAHILHVRRRHVPPTLLEARLQAAALLNLRQPDVV